MSDENGTDHETLRRDTKDTLGGEPVLMISPRLFTIVVLTILALLVLVIVVSLARDDLDGTGVATVLSTLFSGIVVGAMVKGRDRSPPGRS